MKKLFLILLASSIIAGCASTTTFEQTCLTCVSSQRFSCKKGECPESFMVGNDCYVTIIETGENIYLNDILKEEQIQPRNGINFSIAKYNGRYFLYSDSFTKMWLIIPHKKNIVKYKSIELPEKNLGLAVFEINEKLLRIYDQNRERFYVFDDEKDKWINNKSVKAGE
ncbi:MAG: hypothetical protein WHV28_06420 [Bacteroidota bacterium]